uniref:Uncharacterized protein n=1 Tax=Arundo donax TaxID=35708 RepID=A0A0A8ZX58_ARUDO
MIPVVYRSQAPSSHGVKALHWRGLNRVCKCLSPNAH